MSINNSENNTNHLNTSDLARAYAERTGTTIKDSKVAVEAMLQVIADALVEGKEVALHNLFKIQVVERSAHKNYSGLVGGYVDIPARKKLTIKAYKPFSEQLNG
jgi:nucleoid DNA-binding protein